MQKITPLSLNIILKQSSTGIVSFLYRSKNPSLWKMVKVVSICLINDRWNERFKRTDSLKESDFRVGLCALTVLHSLERINGEASFQRSTLRRRDTKWLCEFNARLRRNAHSTIRNIGRSLFFWNNKDQTQETSLEINGGQWGESGDSHGGGGSQEEKDGTPGVLLENMLFPHSLLGRVCLWRREDLHCWGTWREMTCPPSSPPLAARASDLFHWAPPYNALQRAAFGQQITINYIQIDLLAEVGQTW